MKQTTMLALLALQLGAAAQTTPAAQLRREGRAYLKGVARPYDPIKAKGHLQRAAQMGDAPAMAALGDLYTTDRAGAANADSAQHWYRAAAQRGHHIAWFYLGMMHKNGLPVPQDFAKAAGFFAQGAAMGEENCRFMMAYLHYKGLGLPQDYRRAYEGFAELGKKQVVPAYFFLALCLRNGYGTAIDTTAARYWLQKAAAKGDPQAQKELREPLPENIGAVSPHLQQQLAALEGYREKFAPAEGNDYGGDYAGHIVYYDWSRRHVTDIRPLRLSLHRTGRGYAGQWAESGDSATAIGMRQQGGQLVFDKGNGYERTDHYSGRKPERWLFNSAQLQWGFNGDSVLLTGAVRFYSEGRREPGKPVRVVLKKAIGATGAAHGLAMTLLPNPTKGGASVRITLAAAATVAVTVSAQDGRVLFVGERRTLPPGSYVYALPVEGYAAGTYLVQAMADGQRAATASLVKL
jgi:uncharacterized protein